MFPTIFKFELKYWLKNPSFYIYTFAFLFLAALIMAGTSGVFEDESASPGNFTNSPSGLFTLFNFFNKLLLFLLPAVIGSSIYRDYINNAHNVLYSYPFTKTEYFSGKFLSSFLIVSIISFTIGLGFIIGTHIPGMNRASLLPFDLSVYIQIYSLYVIPNIILTGIIVFAVVTFTRNIYAGFVTILLFLIARETLFKLAGGTEISNLFSLLDPFGEASTYFYSIKSVSKDKNIASIPFGINVIYNRIFWLAIAALIFGTVYRWFSFSQSAVSLSFKKIKPEIQTYNINEGSIIKIELPKVKLNFSFANQIKTSWKLSGIDFKYIVTSGSFISILIAGMLFIFVVLFQMNLPYGAKILPVTWIMLGFPIYIYSLLTILMTFLYAGILIQRSKTANIGELTDITPVSDLTFLLSKFLALLKMQVLLLSIAMISGIIVQAYQGYYNFEISHYLFDLFVIHLTGFIIWALASLLIQTIFNNSYLGLFFLIIGSIGISELPRIGIEKLIFRFNQVPEPGFFLNYSDLSGYGHSLTPYFIYKTYWIIFGLILFSITLLFWQRGLTQSFKERILTALERIKGKYSISIIILLIIFLSLGFWINKEENSSAKLISEDQKNVVIAEANIKYQKFANTIQPRIVSVNVNMNIFPESRSFNSDGEYLMINKSDQIIDTLLINYDFDVITEYQFDRPIEIISRDTISRFDIILLNKGLNPGDSILMNFKVRNISNTLLHKNSIVEKNGSFITSIIYPGIGFRFDNSDRSPFDSLALRNHYRSVDSDFIDFETTVSTSADQIAIAPGYLQKEWIENDRRYFIYKSAGKVTNDFVFNTGRYEIKKDKWNDISLEIYYHKGHEYNLENLMDGMKAALEYNEKYFGPYQHSQARIIEYSRAQGDFAQSFANTIPNSEINFMMEINEQNEEEINLPFLGAAHELTHQWWGHQIVPADVAGIRMITESMSEYVSLMALEKKYGKNMSQRFLKKANGIYFNNRYRNDYIEKPLMYNSGLEKSYIPYQKGSIVFYAMSDFLGEENFNNSLKKYFEKAKYQNAPYSTTLEMLKYIRQATPDSLKYLIKDLFETVSFYNNRILNAKTEKLQDGKYKVEIEFLISKYRLDDKGLKIYEDNAGEKLSYESTDSEDNTFSLPLSDYIEIGIFSTDNLINRYPENSIFLKKFKADSIKNKISIIVDNEPAEVCIDPHLTLIDIKSEDNRKAVLK